MLKYFFLFVVFSLLFSCSDNNQDVNLQKQLQSDTSKKANSILFSNPQVIDSSHIIIYPLIFEKASYDRGFGSSSNGDRTSYWNLIFYNSVNNTQHLLVDNKKIVIYSFNVSNNSSVSSDDILTKGIDIYKSNIFYDVVSCDFNQNKYLDVDDPMYLYISDKQGDKFRQLSPDNYNITSWQVVTGTSKIILQAQKDIDKKKFDRKDPVIPLIVDIATGNIGIETFNQSYLNNLQIILSNIWNVDKK